MKVTLKGGSHDGEIHKIQKDWTWICLQSKQDTLWPLPLPPDEFYERKGKGFRFIKQRA